MIALEPVGTFHTDSKYPYEARRQGAADTLGGLGEVRLSPGFEQCVHDLEGFDRVWLIYQFHQNSEWKPKVMPPRGPRVKRGVFATRAPYRPNALGLSCVRLVQVDGLRVVVEGHDLLDGTPVLDIKPYLPYADSFPEAKVGWLEEVEALPWQVTFSPLAERQIEWLEARGVSQLRGFVLGQLEFDPLDGKRKRVVPQDAGFVLAYRTWRVEFRAEKPAILIVKIDSGYSTEDLADPQDKYQDKATHREFLKWHS